MRRLRLPPRPTRSPARFERRLAAVALASAVLVAGACARAPDGPPPDPVDVYEAVFREYGGDGSAPVRLLLRQTAPLFTSWLEDQEWHGIEFEPSLIRNLSEANRTPYDIPARARLGPGFRLLTPVEDSVYRAENGREELGKLLDAPASVVQLSRVGFSGDGTQAVLSAWFAAVPYYGGTGILILLAYEEGRWIVREEKHLLTT